MSLETKVSMLQNLKRQLSSSIPAADMEKVLSIVSDTLESYDLTFCGSSDTAGSSDLFDAYISAMMIQGRSQNTIVQYRYMIGRLLRDLNVPVRSITVYHIRSWLTKEKGRGISDSTLENDRHIFNSFFSWLLMEGLIDRNPVANIGVIKSKKMVREAYTDVDLEKLRAAISSPRYMALFSILTATGGRISEITGMNRDDIDFHAKEIIVLGKGNKERTVYFDDVTAMHLKRYLDTRKDENPALFLNHHGERIKPNGVRFILHEIAKAAGVTTKVHPHKFRRTLATTLNSRGMPIQEVASILGHEKIDTTMRYVVMDKSAVKSSYHKYA